jgi:hypothetical protein
VKFEKGTKCVRIITVMGTKTATIDWSVSSIESGIVKIARPSGDVSACDYNAKTGREVNAAIPGCSSEIVAMDGD